MCKIFTSCSSTLAKWRITHCISQNPLLWRPYSALPYSVSNIEIDRCFSSYIIKGHDNEADFLGFCRNWFLIDPLHHLSSHSDFGFEFAEIFIIEKRLPDSVIECLKENSASRKVIHSSLFKFFKIYHRFSEL